MEKVIFIGPDTRAHGGIASVLDTYRRNFATFTHLSTNSVRGKIPGYVNCLAALAQLPLMRLRGYRIAHIHHAAGKSWTRKCLIMRWARALGYRTVMHCHTGHFPAMVERHGADRIGRTLRKADAVAVLTSGWADYFRSTLGIANPIVVNNPVEPAPPQPTRPVSPDKVRLLYLGAIVQAKGVFDLLEALAALPAELRARVHLTIGGAGEDTRLLADIDRLGLTDTVTFAGWITGERKEQLFAASDILLLPSYAEGLPISILEAMARGMGLIVSNVGGIPSLVADGENGFVITPGSIPSLTSAIAAYATAPTLIATHGEKSLTRIAPYLPSAVEKTLSEIYAEMLLRI